MLEKFYLSDSCKIFFLPTLNLNKMERLEVISKPFLTIRKWLGIFLTLAGITLFISLIEEVHKVILVIASIGFIFNGVYHLTNGFGLEKTWLLSGPDFLTIKWSNKLNPVTIHIAGIREITLTRTSVIISCKSRKPLKLDIAYLETAQKKKIYEFLVSFSADRNLKLVRDF
jgi:hypothetical protein